MLFVFDAEREAIIVKQEVRMMGDFVTWGG